MATSDITGDDKGPQEECINVVLKCTKPLHRFVQESTQTIGIVVLILGCVELLMAIQLVIVISISYILFAFFQGAVFLVCGILSIHAVKHPSKEVVTACLAMYVVTLLGIIVVICSRMSNFVDFFHQPMEYNPVSQQAQCIEAILVISSLCVFALLVFLSVIARSALKSTQSQAIVQHIKPAMTQSTISTE